MRKKTWRKLLFFLCVNCYFFHALPLSLYEFVAAGAHHTVVVTRGGAAWAVGRNDFGQLGDGTTVDRDTLVHVLDGVRSVAAGRHHTIFVKHDGTAWATGSNSYGQLGHTAAASHLLRSLLRPVRVMSDVRAAAAGDRHSVFVTTGGAAYATGDNRNGQLGDGTLNLRAVPVQVFDKGVRDVAAGSEHSVFIMTDGRAMGSGANFNGQLDNNIAFNCGKDCQLAHFQQLHPRVFGSRKTYVQRAFAGGNTTILLEVDGAGWGCGKNDLGQLCKSEWGSISDLVRVPPMYQSFASMGRHHAVFVGQDRKAFLCGLNSVGQLGYRQSVVGRMSWQGFPIAVLSNVRRAAVGDAHTVFLDVDGRVWAAGSNTYGQTAKWSMPAILVKETTTPFVATRAPVTTTTPLELNSGAIFGIVVLVVAVSVLSIACGCMIIWHFGHRIGPSQPDSDPEDSPAAFVGAE